MTPDEALAHPTWSMGPKITIDSATLANKGLEVIEAHFLFGLPYDRIEVVVHPTSIVHGLVRFRDGAAIAHLGYPDMRVPISYALTYPERAATPVPPLDLTAGPLEFFEPDLETFRMLALAREAGERGGTYPCAYNAANEVAVAAFLDGRIGFLDIAALVEDVLGRVDGAPARDLDELHEADRRARELVGARMGCSRGDRRPRAARDDPRGGPLLRRARGRDDAAQVLPRLRAGDRQDDARRRRVRHRLDPARRLREDPRHEPPVAGRPAQAAAARASRTSTTPSSQRDRRRDRARRLRGAAHALVLQLRPELGETRAWQELEGSLAPDAYWRAATWRRLTAIFAGPAVNLVFAIVLFTALFLVSATRETNIVGKVQAGTPAAAAHVQVGDRVIAVGGPERSRPKDIPAHIRATEGKPFKLVVEPPRQARRRAARGEAGAGRLPDRDRDRGARRAGRVAAGRCARRARA